jgi:hypothetical protein
MNFSSGIASRSSLFASATAPQRLIDTAHGKTRHRPKPRAALGALKHLHHVGGGERKVDDDKQRATFTSRPRATTDELA